MSLDEIIKGGNQASGPSVCDRCMAEGGGSANVYTYTESPCTMGMMERTPSYSQCDCTGSSLAAGDYRRARVRSQEKESESSGRWSRRSLSYPTVSSGGDDHWSGAGI